MSLSARRGAPAAPVPTRAAAPIMRRSISENSSPSGKAQSQASRMLKSSRVATGKPSLNASPRRPAMAESLNARAGRPFASGFQANRSVSLDAATLQLGNDATGQRKKASRVVGDLDGDGNKENIAPMRVVSLATPPRARRRAVVGEGKRAVRIYEVDARLAVSVDEFGGLGIKSPRLHVRGLSDDSDASSSEEAQSDAEERGGLGGRRARSLNLTRTMSSSDEVEDDIERVVFRISKLAMRMGTVHDSESSSDESSEADSRRSSIYGLSDAEESGVEDKEVSSLFV